MAHHLVAAEDPVTGPPQGGPAPSGPALPRDTTADRVATIADAAQTLAAAYRQRGVPMSRDALLWLLQRGTGTRPR